MNQDRPEGNRLRPSLNVTAPKAAPAPALRFNRASSDGEPAEHLSDIGIVTVARTTKRWRSQH